MPYNVVMNRLSCSKNTFHRLADSGELGQVYRIGTRKMVTERGVEEYLQRVCDVDEAKPAAVSAPTPKRAKKPRAKTASHAKAK